MARQAAVVGAAGLAVSIPDVRRGGRAHRTADILVLLDQLAVSVVDLLHLVLDAGQGAIVVAGLLIRPAGIVIAVAEAPRGRVDARAGYQAR
jgi:hypothetical protein